MFKSKLLSKVVNLIDDYRIQMENIRNERAKIELTYKGTTYLDKMQDIKDKEQQLISNTVMTIKEMKKEALDKLKLDFDKNLSGNSITSDINLLNEAVNLSTKELQILYDRYRNNFVMQRAIYNYASKNKINIAINTNRYEEVEEAVTNLFDYSFSYMNSNNIEYNVIKAEYFSNLDNVLENE